MFMDGALRCLRYAFGPNRLHLCGPKANSDLLNFLIEQKPSKRLTFLLKKFKTMYPYLKKIADANKIKDPLDERVVEAYWIGNNLLDKAHLHHSFHVFNVWKGASGDKDKCRVGWGKVMSVDGPFIKIKTNSLLFNKKSKFALGPEIERRILRRLDNDELLDVKAGDIITIHWEIPCEIISKKQLENLKKYTQLSIQLANK